MPHSLTFRGLLSRLSCPRFFHCIIAWFPISASLHKGAIDCVCEPFTSADSGQHLTRSMMSLEASHSPVPLPSTNSVATDPNHDHPKVQNSYRSRIAATSASGLPSTSYATAKPSHGLAAKRPRAPDKSSSRISRDAKRHRAVKHLKLALDYPDAESDEISSDDTVDGDYGKIKAIHLAGGTVLLSTPDPNGGQPTIAELNEEQFEMIKKKCEGYQTTSHHMATTARGNPGVATAMSHVGITAPRNTPASQRPINPPTTIRGPFSRPEPGLATTISNPANPRRLVTEEAFQIGDKLHFKIHSKVHAWYRLRDLTGETDVMRRLNQFVKSDQFLKAGGTGAPEERASNVWRLLLEGKPMSDIPYATPVLFPKDLEHAQKRPVAILLERGEFMVCLQAESKMVVGPTRWGNDEEMLAACVAFCVKVDWADLFQEIGLCNGRK